MITLVSVNHQLFALQSEMLLFITDDDNDTKDDDDCDNDNHDDEYDNNDKVNVDDDIDSIMVMHCTTELLLTLTIICRPI